MSLIQSVKDSSYYQAYSDRIMLWENKMTDLDFYLRHLSQIQLKFVRDTIFELSKCSNINF